MQIPASLHPVRDFSLCDQAISAYWYTLFFPMVAISFNVLLHAMIPQWPIMIFVSFCGWLTIYCIEARACVRWYALRSLYTLRIVLSCV